MKLLKYIFLLSPFFGYGQKQITNEFTEKVEDGSLRNIKYIGNNNQSLFYLSTNYQIIEYKIQNKTFDIIAEFPDYNYAYNYETKVLKDEVLFVAFKLNQLWKFDFIEKKLIKVFDFKDRVEILIFNEKQRLIISDRSLYEYRNGNISLLYENLDGFYNFNNQVLFYRYNETKTNISYYTIDENSNLKLKFKDFKINDNSLSGIQNTLTVPIYIFNTSNFSIKTAKINTQDFDFKTPNSYNFSQLFWINQDSVFLYNKQFINFEEVEINKYLLTGKSQKLINTVSTKGNLYYAGFSFGFPPLINYSNDLVINNELYFLVRDTLRNSTLYDGQKWNNKINGFLCKYNFNTASLEKFAIPELFNSKELNQTFEIKKEGDSLKIFERSVFGLKYGFDLKNYKVFDFDLKYILSLNSFLVQDSLLFTPDFSSLTKVNTKTNQKQTLNYPKSNFVTSNILKQFFDDGFLYLLFKNSKGIQLKIFNGRKFIDSVIFEAGIFNSPTIEILNSRNSNNKFKIIVLYEYIGSKEVRKFHFFNFESKFQSFDFEGKTDNEDAKKKYFYELNNNSFYLPNYFEIVDLSYKVKTVSFMRNKYFVGVLDNNELVFTNNYILESTSYPYNSSIELAVGGLFNFFIFENSLFYFDDGIFYEYINGKRKKNNFLNFDFLGFVKTISEYELVFELDNKSLYYFNAKTKEIKLLAESINRIQYQIFDKIDDKLFFAVSIYDWVNFENSRSTLFEMDERSLKIKKLFQTFYLGNLNLTKTEKGKIVYSSIQNDTVYLLIFDGKKVLEPKKFTLNGSYYLASENILFSIQDKNIIEFQILEESGTEKFVYSYSGYNYLGSINENYLFRIIDIYSKSRIVNYNINTKQLYDIEGADYKFKTDGKIIFAKNSTETGTELWISDFTEKGTRILNDIEKGTFSSNPENPFLLDNKLFCFATTKASGYQLWQLDYMAPPKPVLESKEPSILAYPNPSYGLYRFVSSVNTPDLGDISIHNILGIKVFETDNFKINEDYIDISRYESGLYFVNYHIGKLNIRTKLFKK